MDTYQMLEKLVGLGNAVILAVNIKYYAKSRLFVFLSLGYFSLFEGLSLCADGNLMIN